MTPMVPNTLLIFPTVAIKSHTGFLLEPNTMKVFSLPDVFLERGEKSEFLTYTDGINTKV